MLKSIVASILAVAASSTFISNPEDVIEYHIRQIKDMKGTTLPVNSVLQSQGSLVYLDNGKSCDGAVTQGIGFTLGECIVRDNEGSGVVYSNCYSSGDQIKYFFTTCTDTTCQEGCTTYSMSQNKCSTEAEPYNGQIVCSSSVDAYHSYSQFELVSKLVNLSKKLYE
jgi:hypothetical protein